MHSYLFNAQIHSSGWSAGQYCMMVSDPGNRSSDPLNLSRPTDRAVQRKRDPKSTRILVIDDDDWIRDVLARVLISHHYQVSTASSAEEALEILQYSQYDLIVSDMMLTGMNGLELTARLHQWDPQLPVILITAHSDPDVMRTALRYGACDFIPKPFTIETVPIIVERNLERRAIEEQRNIDHDEAMMFAAVQVLAASIDAKEPFTAEHSRRVARIAVVLAGTMRLAAAEVRAVDLAAQVHDVGKIGTPDYILNKPGKLTEEEWHIVKHHPIKGAEIVGRVEQLTYVADIVRHHHEWLNGGGYPDGLRGDEIPLLSRVITVADAYEVMTADRVYRKKLSEEEAITRLKEGVGTQFDSAVVEALVRIRAEKVPL